MKQTKNLSGTAQVQPVVLYGRDIRHQQDYQSNRSPGEAEAQEHRGIGVCSGEEDAEAARTATRQQPQQQQGYKQQIGTNSQQQQQQRSPKNEEYETKGGNKSSPGMSRMLAVDADNYMLRKGSNSGGGTSNNGVTSLGGGLVSGTTTASSNIVVGSSSTGPAAGLPIATTNNSSPISSASILSSIAERAINHSNINNNNNNSQPRTTPRGYGFAIGKQQSHQSQQHQQQHQHQQHHHHHQQDTYSTLDLTAGQQQQLGPPVTSSVLVIPNTAGCSIQSGINTSESQQTPVCIPVSSLILNDSNVQQRLHHQEHRNGSLQGTTTSSTASCSQPNAIHQRRSQNQISPSFVAVVTSSNANNSCSSASITSITATSSAAKQLLTNANRTLNTLANQNLLEEDTLLAEFNQSLLPSADINDPDNIINDQNDVSEDCDISDIKPVALPEANFFFGARSRAFPLYMCGCNSTQRIFVLNRAADDCNSDLASQSHLTPELDHPATETTDSADDRSSLTESTESLVHFDIPNNPNSSLRTCHSMFVLVCQACFHIACSDYNGQYACKWGSKGHALPGQVFDKPKPVSEWTSQNVLDLLCVLNLSHYVSLFQSKDIKGSDLLLLDRDKLLSMGVRDEFHLKCLLEVINELCQQTSSPTLPEVADATIKSAVAGTAPGLEVDAVAGSSSSSGLNNAVSAAPNTATAATDNAHDFVSHSFGDLQRCDKCHKHLMGLHHQGLLCRDCGLNVHRTCLATGLTTACVPRQNRIKSVFGLALCMQFDCTKRQAPIVVEQCVRALEERADADKSLNLYKVYHNSPPEEQVDELRQKIDKDMYINLNDYTPNCIAAVLKKFLCALPNTVIPTEYYDRFLEALNFATDEQCADRLNQLVADLPDHHRMTLEYLMRHFCRICQLQNARTYTEPPTILIQALRFMFLRPPFERIMDMASKVELHIRVMELLLLRGKWGESLPQFASAPQLPPRKLSKQQQLSGRYPTSVEDAASSDRQTNFDKEQPGRPMTLQDVEWYVGDATKEVCNELMRDCPDGSFLVRDSISKGGEYTLTLRKGGVNKLIKIYHINGKYGFSEPYKFESVIELVDHYRHYSLAQYNPMLDIKLLYPVSLQQDEEIGCTTDTSKVIRKYIDIVREITKSENQYNDLNDMFDKTNEKMCAKALFLDGFREAKKLLEEQLRLQVSNQKDAQPHEIGTLIENTELLKSRMQTLDESQGLLNDEMRQVMACSKTLEREIRRLQPDIYQLKSQREKYLMWLRKNGVNQERIKMMLNNPIPNAVINEVMLNNLQDLPLDVHADKKTWLYLEGTRLDAERILTGKPCGTFLVRRSHTGQYALSIMCNGIVNHCIIYMTERGFGFADPYNIHKTLKHLVIHYAQNSLEEHNESLKTTLAYPAFAPPSTMARLQLLHMQMQIQNQNHLTDNPRMIV